MKIYERVRQIRQQKGITQTLVASRIPIEVNRYNKAELGLRPLRVEWIAPIAGALGVSPSDFFSPGLDEPSKTEADCVVHSE